ncbi:MAG: 16S rRNA (uracil(1498)-N(3))-methyltransferase [Lachnospiraceae bacterium]|nr:16S rRNA (uracil(1498)-N(3))-methyltransferase [Lachnospiraceae bacterium]
MHHFFVSPGKIDLGQMKVYIDGEDVNHIKNVLRMKAGEEMLVSDGEGNDYICSIEKYEEGSVVAGITDRSFEGTELSSKIYLFQGLPKSDKMELVIRKAVELGVHQIIPVSTKRAIVKLDQKKEQIKIRRWNEISKSAAKQSRRSIVPKVENVMTFGEALEYAKTLDLKLIPYENFKDMTETKKVMKKIKKDMSIGIFIGPEGGFDEQEIERAMEYGIERISLGKRILRTETAGLMIISVIMFELEQ